MPAVTQRDLATLLAYLETGSHKRSAKRMGIAEATSRKRVARLIASVGARNATQAVWAVRWELEALHRLS